MEARQLQKKKRAKSVERTSTTFNEEQITPSNFSFAIMKISVSQICQSVGYRGAQFSALENLTHIAGKYLQALAASAAAFANSSNRTQSNVFDIINGLHDLLSTQGFPGSSIIHREHHCLLGSGVVTELAKFVKCTVETPFAKPIPQGNSTADSVIKSKTMEQTDTRDSHIPKWLPCYPNADTYQKSEENRRRNGEELWEMQG